MLATVFQPALVRTVRGSSQRLPELIAETGIDSHMYEGGKGRRRLCYLHRAVVQRPEGPMIPECAGSERKKIRGK